MPGTPANWDLEVDVVAVGSGLGALSAAITAHDLGLSVAVLEKADKLGGLSGFGGGEVFVPANRHMLKLGLEDTLDEGRAYLDFLTAGFGSTEHLDKLFATSWGAGAGLTPPCGAGGIELCR